MSELGWKYLTRSDKKKILRGVRDGRVYGGPFHVEIHPADRCNIECFFCSTAAIRGSDELPAARLEELIAEMKQAGTRAIRFSGGGEPLFHRRAKDILQLVVRSGIPLENLTTNAVLLDAQVARLLAECCDQVTISLNTFGPASYAKMMKTPERNYHRVLENVRRLSEIRSGFRRRPAINVQFLIWKQNYADIARMYDLALEIGADTVLFSGLSHLSSEDRMTDSEVAEMMAEYEKVIEKDEFRKIVNIGSLERDLSGPLNEVIGRLAAQRRRVPVWKRVRAFLARDQSFWQRISHSIRVRLNAARDQQTSGFNPACVIGWYSMLIRSSGVVAPCCILQRKPLGNIVAQTLSEVWTGEHYQRFRQELTRIIAEKEQWKQSTEATVESVCGLAGSDLCTMKSFYFARDASFVQNLDIEFDRRQLTA